MTKQEVFENMMIGFMLMGFILSICLYAWDKIIPYDTDIILSGECFEDFVNLRKNLASNNQNDYDYFIAKIKQNDCE